MKQQILKLKKLNAAYTAALEYDYCPASDMAKGVAAQFEQFITEEELIDALDEHQGERPDQLALQISELINAHIDKSPLK